MSLFTEAWRTLVPDRESPHGPLPPVLLLLTAVSGLVDAFSYLGLGRVFVANMTGNVVLLGFALGGTSGFLWWASLLALVLFSLGALLGGWIGHRFAHHRGRVVLTAGVVQFAFVLAAFVIALTGRPPYPTETTAALIALLAFALGLQTSTARRLAVPDLTTTVVTMVVTGISADTRTAGGAGNHAGRRLLAIASLILGALVGALFVNAGLAPYSLLTAAVLLAVIVIVGAVVARSTERWTALP